MSRKKSKHIPDASESSWIISIAGVDFVFESTQKGCNCTHYLFRSRRGGYLMSFTDIDMKLKDYEKKSMPVSWTPGREATERLREAASDIAAAEVKPKRSPRLLTRGRRSRAASELFEE